MNDKWFRVYQGVAHGVEYDAENSITTATNFRIEGVNGLLVNVPGQANNKQFIKNQDRVFVCVRPSLFNKDVSVCLAYRINSDGAIQSINEVRHLSVAILGAVFGIVFVASSGWRWPVLFVAGVSIFYSISFLLSLYARGCLARATQQVTD